MKKEILELLETFEELMEKYGYRKLETAIYLYMRSDDETVRNTEESKIFELSKYLENIDGSLFNEDINYWLENNIENLKGGN